jgi:HAD superfamily hydrolase (TIGR01509 family)
MKINAVIFDMDGVIFDTEHLAHESWISVEKEFGIQVGQDFMTMLLGMSHTGILDVYAKYFGDYELGSRIYNWRKTFMTDSIERNGVPVKKGVQELFAYLKEAGLPMALATSSYRPNYERLFRVTGLEDPFSVVITGDTLEHSKPDPEIFLRAAQGLNVPINECLIIEDSYNGVIAGSAAGAITVMVPDMVQPMPEVREKAYTVCESLLDVIPLIKEIDQKN